MPPTDDVRQAAVQDQRYAEWKGWPAERFGQPTRSDRRYYEWHVARCVARGAARPALRVLEVGYGNGGFMGWAKAQGHEVTGIEVQPVLLERARAAGWAVAHGTSALPPHTSFDLVVVFDVLEHVLPADLPGFIADITQHLAPAGRVLVRVPNGDSPFGRPNQHGDLTHVAAYGLAKLRQLAAMHHLKVVAWGEAPWVSQQGHARNFTNAIRAATRGLLEAWVRFAYAWSELSLAPNLVVVLERTTAPQADARDDRRA